MASEPWFGGCFCGEVRYRVSGPGTQLCFCHCTSCRRATGSVMVAWGTFDAERFEVVHGQLAERRSSSDVMRGFCASCGTSMTYRHSQRGSEIDVTLATLDAADAFTPTAHIWVHDKLAWVTLADGLPQFSSVADSGQNTGNEPAPARPGYRSLTARIVARDASGLVAFLKLVFAARGDDHQERPAQLQIGDSSVLVSEAGPRAPMPVFLYVYVNDVDATYARALRAGARSLEAPAVVGYGDYRCMIEDGWGNTWQIAKVMSAGT